MKTNDMNLKDHRYGKLLVVRKDVRKRAGRTLWVCQCDCGKELVMQAAILVRGLRQSCGCTPSKARQRNMNRSEGEADALSIYYGMIARCTRPWLPSWPNYGGRGISVCQEWMDSFEAFYAHVGPRPTKLHSIDRINNDGNYEPGNVRWATRKEQQNNRRGTAKHGRDYKWWQKKAA